MSPTELYILSVFWGIILLAMAKATFALFGRRISYLYFFPLAIFVCFGIPKLEQRMSENLRQQNTVALTQWDANQCVSPDVIRRSVFIVTNAERRGHGTGFLLEDGTIVTNRHVYNAFGEDAVFINKDGQAETQTLTHVADPRTGPDLTFYRMTTEMEGMQGLKIATEAPAVGEPLLIVGQNFRRERFYASVVVNRGYGSSIIRAPIGFMSPLTIASMVPIGIYQGLMSPGRMVDSGGRGTPVMAVHGDVFPGNSGSAVVNCAGEVVGVHYAGRGFILFASEQQGYAVDLATFKAELENVPSTTESETTDDAPQG